MLASEVYLCLCVLGQAGNLVQMPMCHPNNFYDWVSPGQHLHSCLSSQEWAKTLAPLLIRHQQAREHCCHHRSVTMREVQHPTGGSSGSQLLFILTPIHQWVSATFSHDGATALTSPKTLCLWNLALQCDMCIHQNPNHSITQNPFLSILVALALLTTNSTGKINKQPKNNKNKKHPIPLLRLEKIQLPPAHQRANHQLLHEN